MNLKNYLISDLKRFYQLSNRKIMVNGLNLWLMAFNPRFSPVVLCRISRWAYLNNNKFLSYLTMWANVILFGIEITPRADIGEGLFFPHTNGIVLGAGRIGKNVTIYQNVTVGARILDMHYDLSLRPIIEDDVVIASGAKVIGSVTLGYNCRIGANAVVLKDVPPQMVAIGVPATIREVTKRDS